MMWVHLTPNLELANAMLGFAFMVRPSVDLGMWCWEHGKLQWA